MIRPPNHLLSVLFFLTSLFTPFFYLSTEPTKASNVEESSSQNFYRSLIKLCVVILEKAVKLTKTDMDDKLLETVKKAIETR